MHVLLYFGSRRPRGRGRATNDLNGALPDSGGGCTPFLMIRWFRVTRRVRLHRKRIRGPRAKDRFARLLARARFDARHLEDPDLASWNHAFQTVLR